MLTALGMSLAISTGAVANEPVYRYSKITGAATFLTSDDGQPLAVNAAAGGVAVRANAATQALDQYAAPFGVTDAAIQLQLIKVDTDLLGHVHTTYQQVHDGIEVFTGILKVHEDANGGFLGINGDFYAIPAKFETAPTVTPEAALTAAFKSADIDSAPVERNQLAIVDPGWYGDPSIGPRLAHHVILNDMTVPMREAFFVDAHSGEVLDRWSMIHTARQRQIYDGQTFGSLPGVLARSEGDPPVVSPEDVNRAYDYYQDVYDYFLNAFGRDSIDDNGLTLVATVNSNAPDCPNAFWNGQQMVFCDGTVTDDIVAHELAHGVTQYTANLVYQNQSGQLNESFSDVFGELVDLYNGGVEISGAPTATPFGNHATGPGQDTPNLPRSTVCSSSATLDITAPAGLVQSLAGGPASSGPALTAGGLSGNVVAVDPATACDFEQPFANEAAINGNIALAEFGGCDTIERIINLQDAGAIGVILVDFDDAFPLQGVGGGGSSIVIPSIVIPASVGAAIRNELNVGPVSVTMRSLGYVDGVRWMLGEDAAIFGGAIRDMWNPPCEGHPDLASSALQTCNVLDSGGVHSGSGIPNHAFAMLTDGKTFNGVTVTGIGPIKAGAIWYRALSVYLTPASDFDDSVQSFMQAANDLVGFDPNDPRDGLPSGDPITTADVQSVLDALTAVEMPTVVACGAGDNVLDSIEPERCVNRTTIFADDFESGAAGWTVSNTSPPTPYDWELTVNPLPYSVPGVAYFCADADVGDCGSQDESAVHSLMSPVMTVPVDAEHVRVSFMHLMGSEGAWDGGNLKIDVSGNGWQVLPRTAYTYNHANAPINTFGQGNTNPLAGEPGWTGAGGGWGRSVADLSSLVAQGDTLQLRFDFGKDGCSGIDGWYVDDVEVYNCEDCDTDGTADIDQFRHVDSSIYSGNIGDGSPQSFFVAAPPVANGDVTLRVQARGDFSSFLEYLDVFVNAVPVGRVFEIDAGDCAGTPETEVLTISAVDFNTAVVGGDALIEFFASSEVNPALNSGACRGASYVAFSLQYDLDVADCNDDGLLDGCQAGGSDIAALVAELLNPSGAACLFDYNNDSVVDGRDIQGFIDAQLAP